MEIKTISLKFTSCFLVPVGSKYLLIDTGYEYEWHDFMDGLGKNNVHIDDIKYLLLTHHHDDHSGLLNNISGMQGFNGFFDTFIVLGLLKEALQRNIRWHLSLY